MTRQSEETAVAIARLTQEGFDCKDRDRETALEKFQLAYQKSRLIDDDDTERTCAFNLGAAFVGLSRAKEGLKYLHKATPPESEGEDSSSGDLFFNMGMAYEQLGEESSALKYYEKAHEEFQLKGGSNFALEMHCLQKCLSLQQKLKKFADSAKVYKQMAAVHSAKRDYVGQADCLCKTAIQYQRAKQYEKATAAAMESVNVFSEFMPEGKECLASARVLNELGLLYTQVQSYPEALQCFERALEHVSTGNGDDPQLQVVIKQNLGAAYNFLGDFQRAIKFHEEAIEHYSKLNYRNGQGQCFTNLAFALSQLVPPELKDAEVAFHHALRASKDTGDNNMRWQVLEGLGAVNFNQLCFEDAIGYFQDALQWVGQNKAASDRIKAKLRLVTEYNFNQRKAGVPLQFTGKPDMMVTAERSPRLGMINEGTILQKEAMVAMTPEMPMMSRSEEAGPAGVDRPQVRRFIGIMKRDSFAPHLPKVAKGLTTMSMDSRTSVSARSVPRGLQVEESESSSESSSSEDSSDEEESKSTVSSSSEDKNGDAGIQSEKVEEIFSPKRMKNQELSYAPTYGGPKYENVRQGAADPAEQYQQALREKEAREDDEESESDSDSSSSGEDSSGEETSEEEEEANQRQVAGPPPIPTQSPPHTTVVNTQDLATYQVSQAQHNAPYNSGSSDRVRNSAGFEDPHQTTSKATEDDEDPYAVIDQTTRSQFPPTVEGNSISHEQSITHNPQTRVAHKRTRQRSANFFASDDESNPDEHTGQPDQSSDMSDRGDHGDTDVEGQGQIESRGQQEMRLYHEHQRLRQEQEGPPLPPRGNEKPSKTCVVM